MLEISTPVFECFPPISIPSSRLKVQQMLTQIYVPLTKRTFNCNKRLYATSDSERRQLDNRKHTLKYCNVKY